MAHCNSTKTWNGEPCPNEVSRRGKRCREHTLFGLLFRSPKPVLPRQTPRAARTPMRAATRLEGVRIATEQWQSIVAAQAQLAIPAEAWQSLTEADAPSTCTRFAQLAALDSPQGHSVGPIAPQVAAHLATRLAALGTPEHLPQSLQVLGVYLCATQNRDLGDCRCLRDLIQENGLATAKRILQNAMSDLSPTGG
ncbi:hypothetical protein [Actinokineospora diospyrosa]|uniref:hypothetical protein n=1 Tax=Actinokineospora diospyrosa TaxID=103728 RepID=UPI0020A39FC1|nr:hypothetical protein [Actinokineospora diospyrosa]